MEARPEYASDEDGEGVGPMRGFASADDAEEAVRAIGQTPMLESVQKMLREQQVKELHEKQLNLQDLEEELRRGQKQREGLGVQLYGLQQQLASLQLKLEDSHGKVQETMRARSSSEREAVDKKQILDDFQKELSSSEDKLKAAKAEENAVKAAVKQVESFLEETRGEIAVMRRATHKTDEAVAELEKKKSEQDLYIDARVERVAQLQEELALVEAQRQSQRLETGAAESTLREAAKEMATTVFEKRQVVAQWNSTLIALSKRDEAHQSMVDAIRERQEDRRTVISEVEGLKKSAQKVQFESEQLVERKLRQESALKAADESLAKHERAYGKLAEHFSVLKKSLEQQDAEARRLKGMLSSAANELRAGESQTQAVERQRHALELEADALVNDRVTASKASKNLGREAGKLQKYLHAKDLELAAVENETARVRIDKLSTQSHTEQLAGELALRLDELKDKGRLIEKYKAEIRQRHDQIEKRTYVVDRLNRKLDKMVANEEEPESLGPLEATIKNLSRETQALEQQNRELERQWLRLQTEFVKVVSEAEAEQATVQELSSTETILLQKRTRLDGKIAQQNTELKELEGQVRRMHNDMHKLNELIAEHKGKHEELANTNEVMQADFVAELKELERQSVASEAAIEKTKLDKQQLLDEILESERQIKLWEKKIQLEKETQAALDPTVGQGEVKAMEKEIHRMRVRYDNLTREQERMIKDMETAILKRETITSRSSKNASQAAKHLVARGPKNLASDDAIAELTVADLARKLKDEAKRARQFSKECHESERAIADKIMDSENTSLELEKASAAFATIEDDVSARKRAINDALYLKQKNIENINRMQLMAQKYIDFSKHPIEDAGVAQEEVDILLDQSQDQIQTIVHTLKAIGGSQPHLVEVLDRVAKLLE